MVVRKQKKVLVKGIAKKSPKVDFQRFTDEAHQKRRVVNTKTTGHRFNWKMMRFTLYIWARVEEHKTLVMKPKIDTVRELVSTAKFKRLWETFPQSNSFSHEREVKNLAQLISEPRQQIYFKSNNFKFEGKEKLIPQELLDKIK